LVEGSVSPARKGNCQVSNHYPERRILASPGLFRQPQESGIEEAGQAQVFLKSVEENETVEFAEENEGLISLSAAQVFLRSLWLKSLQIARKSLAEFETTYLVNF
jgi:hypothetical protein